MRATYDWVLGLADKPNGERALGALSFAESSFFPIPPDVLLLALGVKRPDRAIRFALITTVTSVLGAFLGYWIGAALMDSVGDWLLDLYDADRHTWNKIEGWYDAYGWMALFIAALTPIPFKVFTIASGAMALPLPTFALACVVGRGIRFFAEGILLRFFGAPIASWIERWFNWLALLFVVLLVGGFLMLGALGE